jgi:hypothetical protein
MYQKFALKIGDETRNLIISCRRNPKVAFKGTKKSKSCSSNRRRNPISSLSGGEETEKQLFWWRKIQKWLFSQLIKPEVAVLPANKARSGSSAS